MGNRRMGLGRMEALLEAIDRDLNLENTTLDAPTITNAVSIDCAGALVVDTTSTLTGAVTCTVGSQNLAVAVTATADGTGTAIIPNGTSFATVTSANAAHWAVLPAPVPGTILHLNVTANGCELRSSAPSTVLINAGSGGAAVESAIGANVLVRCICIDATHWICNKFVAAGTESALEAAA
jgi:hypothetical protein